jgi:hypothetical protein
MSLRRRLTTKHITSRPSRTNQIKQKRRPLFERLELRYALTALAGDFNGDGFDDIAVGAPGEDVGTVSGAGAVNVIYGSSNGLRTSKNQFWQQNELVSSSSETDDAFGSALAAGDFNDDGYDDLAIGVPKEDADSVTDCGAINILYGSSSGLKTGGNRFITQTGLNGGSKSETGDNFGAALAVGDFDNDGVDDLAVGIPLENHDSISNAGGVYIVYGKRGSGLTATRAKYFSQASDGVLDSAETDDRFGSALAAGDFNDDGRDDLAIGVPNEGLGVISQAGAVNVLYGSSSGITATGDQFWHQDVSGVLGAAETSDHFGAALAAGDFNGGGADDLAIGVPDEDLGGASNCGQVNILPGKSSKLTATGDQQWDQGTANILGTRESGDRFGAALASGDFNGNSRDDLAIGVPGEQIGGTDSNGFLEGINAGTVNVLYGSSSGLSSTGNQIWDQAEPGVPGEAEDYDRFGAALVAGDFDGNGRDDLAVGVPGESIGSVSSAGDLMVFYGTSPSRGLTTVGIFDMWQDKLTGSTSETFDLFGAKLG